MSERQAAERCSELVGRDRMGVGQCMRNATVRRGGEPYCTQHDPSRKVARHNDEEAKRAAESAEWNARADVRRTRAAIEQAAIEYVEGYYSKASRARLTQLVVRLRDDERTLANAKTEADRVVAAFVDRYGGRRRRRGR